MTSKETLNVLEQHIERSKNLTDALQNTEDQTPEICMEAVKQNGRALEFVRKFLFRQQNKSGGILLHRE